ncbi:DHHC palmitoyltransferase-domain-containing protein [Chytriomyces cf. hyalinus JEL632]|nr:DHHC palmitoyltransferase-domain-containing protein [Chytriomyces cf. hyalinus JEL632]
MLWIVSYIRVIVTLPGHPRGTLPRISKNSSSDHLVDSLPIESSQDSLDDMPLIHMTNNIEHQRGPSFVALETKQDGMPRYCNKCNTWKPDRAHHCSQCGVCVLRMDHHCIFINCCVGWRNHKYFFLFLFYTVLYCFGMFGFLLHFLLAAMNAHTSEEIVLQLNLHWLLLVFISAAFGFVLLAFTGLHLMYILTNKTTIESMERARRYRVDYAPPPGTESDGSGVVGRTTKSKWGVNIFDLGARENWKAVMGNDWRLWFLPVDSIDGDGHTFQVNYQAMEKLRQEDV